MFLWDYPLYWIKYCLASVIILGANNDMKVTDYTRKYFLGELNFNSPIYELCSTVDSRKRYLNKLMQCFPINSKQFAIKTATLNKIDCKDKLIGKVLFRWLILKSFPWTSKGNDISVFALKPKIFGSWGLIIYEISDFFSAFITIGFFNYSVNLFGSVDSVRWSSC